MDKILEIIRIISFFDLCYIFVTILSLIKCWKQGFVLSIMSASKWLLAYILTLFVFPRVKPYFKDIIDNNYVLDIILGISIFVILIFIILLINKGISRAVKYTGIGTMDKLFGFFFGFVRSYFIVVCIFTTLDIVYNYERWPTNLSKSLSFEWVEKGSNYLIREFPSQKEQENAKEKIKDI